MRRSVIVWTFAALVALAAPTPALAAVLYDDGPVNGTNSGWDITSSEVGDSFPLASPSTVTDVTFDSYTLPGETITQVDWMIASLPDGTGVTYGSGTVAVSSTFLFFQSSATIGFCDLTHGCDIDLNSFSIPPLNLAAGTYWLVLSNAVGPGTFEALWDINGGPSQIWESALGYDPAPADFCPGFPRCSDTFQILGTTQAAAPEPASLSLMVGALAAVGLLRRRAKRARATGLKP